MAFMKSVNLQKEYSEAVNRRIRDNTMTKRKRTMGQTTIYKTPHKKNTNPAKSPE
jgi:hypothetical protein